MIDYPHYTGLEGAQNTTGFQETIFVAQRSKFTTLAAPSATPSAVGDYSKITTDHAFGVSDGFIKLKMTTDSVELNSEPVGDNADSMGQKVTLTGFMAGLNAKNLELNRFLRNEDLIVLIQDCNGTTFQLGSKCSAVNCAPAVTGGKRSSGSKGTTWTFTYFGELFVYEGDIVEKP